MLGVILLTALAVLWMAGDRVTDPRLHRQPVSVVWVWLFVGALAVVLMISAYSAIEMLGG